MLSRPQDCRVGTGFFRHLPTGTDHAPTRLAELQAMGLESFDAVQSELIARDSNDASKWGMTMRVSGACYRAASSGPSNSAPRCPVFT
jgi:hypothetical protein